MKNFKLFGAVLSMCLAIPLVACNGGSSGSEESSSNESGSTSEAVSYSLITQPPTYSEESVQIHYLRSDANYSNWALWLWGKNVDGKEYAFNGEDTRNGAIASYKVSDLGLTDADETLGFIVKSAGDWSKKDVDSDRFALLTEFTMDENKVHHVYLKSGKSEIYDTIDYGVHDALSSAIFQTNDRITCTASSAASKMVVYEDGVVLGEKTFTNKDTFLVYDFPTGKTAQIDSDYTIDVTFLSSGKTLSAAVGKGKLFKTTEFDEKYTYSGHDLGATYTAAATTFKVWSPVAKSITVRVYDNGTPVSVNATKGNDTYTEYPLTKGEKGVYSASVTGDLAAKYYTYFVKSRAYPNGVEIVDPYAKSAGISGLRGQIVNFDAINASIDGFSSISPLAYDRKSMVTYETHLTDLTSSSTWSQDTANAALAKTYKGAYLSGTTYTKDGTTVKTGFDHVVELKPSAVELLPIFDQANDETKQVFNWGYNPLNYNVLEGSYSSDPYDGYARIKEFKQLVMAYNKAGINIIMDVVYNHVNGLEGSNFDVLCPGYFFRYDNGKASNGSGCGNETASEMPMFRLFMEDSTAFWAKEYKLGGFRFDLMGLHDLETMSDVVTNLKTINPNIVVYGEPWTGGTSTLDTAKAAIQANLSKYEGYGAFNDQMRDALIKGGLNSADSLGWADKTTGVTESDITSIIGGIKGGAVGTSVSIIDPDKTVNYVSCHDNYTLVDRFEAAKVSDKATREKMALLAQSLVMTSQGTSFMLAGEEFFRTKGGNSNSYNASYEVNALDYSLKITNASAFASYKKLLALKEGVDGLALAKDAAKTMKIAYSDDENQISYSITDTTNSRTYKVIHNNGYNESSLPTADLSGYTLYLDTLNRSDLTLNANTSFKSYETVIAYKDNN